MNEAMAALQAYRVSAYNSSKLSENKIHDDTVAQRFGFSGGLVPGVDVMAYMMHLPTARWGRDFLERGAIEARFLKPVYEGETVQVTGEVTGEIAGDDSNGVLAIAVTCGGELRAQGSATLPAAAPVISVDDYPPAAPASERKPVSPSSFQVGQWLGTAPRDWAGDAARQYLADIRETDPIYLREGLGHPGMLQKVMNRLLVDNVILGPWIHVGSRMQLLSAARIDDVLTARAKVTANYEKKGHRFVELDALLLANGNTPLAHCWHVAIYQPRERAS